MDAAPLVKGENAVASKATEAQVSPTLAMARRILLELLHWRMLVPCFIQSMPIPASLPGAQFIKMPQEESGTRQVQL